MAIQDLSREEKMALLERVNAELTNRGEAGQVTTQGTQLQDLGLGQRLKSGLQAGLRAIPGALQKGLRKLPELIRSTDPKRVITAGTDLETFRAKERIKGEVGLEFPKRGLFEGADITFGAADVAAIKPQRSLEDIKKTFNIESDEEAQFILDLLKEVNR